MAAEKMFDLKFPIERTINKGRDDERIETISSVTLRRPTGKDMRLIDRHAHEPIAMTLAMIEALSELDADAVDRLDSEDVDSLGEFALPSVAGGQETGGTA